MSEVGSRDKSQNLVLIPSLKLPIKGGIHARSLTFREGYKAASPKSKNRLGSITLRPKNLQSL